MQTTRSTSSAAVGLAFQAGSRHIVEIHAPRAAVWDALIDADHRHQWLGRPSTIIEARWPQPRRSLELPLDEQLSPRVVRWRPVPRVVLHTTRPDGVVARLEIELHEMQERTLTVLDEVALHPATPTRHRPSPWRTRHWSQRSLGALRRLVEHRS